LERTEGEDTPGHMNYMTAIAEAQVLGIDCLLGEFCTRHAAEYRDFALPMVTEVLATEKPS
jgi:hypothetical protein